jgi:hypothetical protein
LQDLRPAIPADTHPMLVNLLQKCWQKDPALRPTFAEILDILDTIKEVCVHRSKYAFSSCFSFELHVAYFVGNDRWFDILGITRCTLANLILVGGEAVDVMVFCLVFHAMFKNSLESQNSDAAESEF